MTAVPMPEAVAKVENGLLAWHITDPFAHVDTNLLRGRNLLFTTHQVESYGDARAKEATTAATTAARAEALKEAATACDRIVTAYREFYKGSEIIGERYSPQMENRAQGAYDAAEGVRALMKEQSNGT